ncbi:type IV pilin protein [Amphritea opalescens]|uniref:Type IV pilin protein n=2 Tax=Amphritea opalescens TaxID=2490544 RepID=A0A430KLN5_9GAMM|nr:type IV pilin protein [Amphritea opalescens]
MNKGKGFTLIELMITVAIIGILIAIAYPSYINYVRTAKRADAQANLVELSQWMERRFTVNGSYLASGAAPALPFTKSPQDGTEVAYNLTVSAARSSYTLTATPDGSQADDTCGTMSVTQTGAKTAAESDCW